MKKSIRKQVSLLVVILIMVVALVVVPGLTLAHGEAIQVDPLQGRPGEEVTVTGTGWEAGGTVRITLEGTRGITSLGTVQADAKGGFILKVTLPEDQEAGSYRLVARLGDESAVVDFSVLEAVTHNPQTATSGGEVAIQRTTAETIAVGIIVVALIGAGAFLVFMGTERRAHPQV